MAEGYLFPAIPDIVSMQQISIMLEVWGEPKPGNVTRDMPFSDLSYEDFMGSAVSIEKPLAVGYRDARRRVEEDSPLGGIWGKTLLASSREAMRGRSNAIFGTLLVGIPLGVGASLSRDVDEILPLASKLFGESDARDSLDFRRAVEISEVGGLAHPYMDGEAGEMNLESPDFDDMVRDRDVSLGDLLRLSRSYDLLAGELAGGFPITSRHAPMYLTFLKELQSPSRASGMIFCTLLSRYADTLVARKAGRTEAERVREMAETAMELDPFTNAWLDSMASIDGHLRGRGLNPGTLADLTSTSIFLALLGAGH